jgi:hypothetical protein
MEPTEIDDKLLIVIYITIALIGSLIAVVIEFLPMWVVISLLGTTVLIWYIAAIFDILKGENK